MANASQTFKWSLVGVMIVGTVAAGSGTDLHGQDEVSPEIELRKDLLSILDEEQLHSALAGVHVQYAETGEELFSHQSHTSLAPASGQKLLVGATALDVLGPDFTFETGVYTDGDLQGNELHGNVYIKGGGDPTMLPDDYEQFAQALREAGIEQIHGDIIADDSYFDDRRLSLDLSWANQRGHVGAQVSALSVAPDATLISDLALDRYNTGSIYVEVHPGEEVGDAADIRVTPESDYFTIDNQMTTVEEGGERALTSWDRAHGTNDIHFDGTIPVGANPFTQYVSIWEPTELVLNLFHDGLGDENIEVHGELVLGETPEDAEQLAHKQSMTLEQLMIPFMKFSQNNHSEHLTKTLGKVVEDEGSWDAGLAVVEEYLDSAGVDMDVVQLRDGSGMSHLNAIPAEQMTQLLSHVQTEDWYEVFYDSLPVAGEPDHYVGGTLRTRMVDTAAEGNVTAKTGSLTSKSSLSGYVTDADGHELIFAMLFNNYKGSSPTSVENEIAVRLAEYSAEGDGGDDDSSPIRNVKPAEDVTLRAGESVKVSFEGEPGLEAAFSIRVPLFTRSAPPTEVMMREAEEGVYEGYWTATNNLSVDGAQIEIRAVNDKGEEYRDVAEGRITIER
ncbi:D-alanyl-D-alanine carboxypeptidase/D-alanyl-D-alanine-endopeptidase [Geomicrobium sp. JCM 19039]|uniref:D-alanyl-D-alanine carboxypeptidase/D-alanyl-D-alanine endopeptidase n=1 Tax=Geomicrobium sp. JCM 19039 TaxID=1460636 RepID=UPI00045F2D37|nr:D-alanyl-D-alanine carboxypeptidase/D-alanyl-D-alanine-endopeptidase [Geomicrobium sp. JCM 19039]GAK12155.1 D-alanyl-D-alanine carboxypeptidase [Geomicrobium sp. JCM 19039]